MSGYGPFSFLRGTMTQALTFASGVSGQTIKMGTTGGEGVGVVSGFLAFYTGATVRWSISSSGHLSPFVNNTYDLGTSDERVRDAWLARNVDIGGTLGVTGKVTTTGEIQIGGALNHDGSTFGVFGITPTTRATAFTQTYATATKTHAAPTGVALTHAVGTADGTVADVGAAFNQTTLNNNFKDITTVINQIIADIANSKQVSNAIIDDLQLYGLLQ